MELRGGRGKGNVPQGKKKGAGKVWACCQEGESAINFLKKRFYFFREGEGKEKGRETLMCERNFNRLPLQDQGRNPSMCPDLGLNLLFCGMFNQLSYIGQG